MLTRSSHDLWQKIDPECFQFTVYQFSRPRATAFDHSLLPPHLTTAFGHWLERENGDLEPPTTRCLLGAYWQRVS